MLLRVAVYLEREPLWGDELSLAVNFHRPIFEQVAGQPAAPPGFLLLARVSYLAFGNSELALRLVPLLAGLLALPLFYWLAQRVLSPTAIVFALVLFVLSPYLIYYSSEVKQYSVDVLVAVGLTLATVRTIQRRLTPSAALRLGVLGFLLVWFSQPAVFVLAGMGIVLVVAYGRARALWGSLLIVGVFWGAGAAAVVWTSRRAQTPGFTGFMQWFWADNFVPFNAPWRWLDAWLLLMAHPGSLLVPFTGFLALGGLLLLPPKRRLAFALLFAPLVVAFVASLLRAYPWSPLAGHFRSGRLLLFAAPALILGMAAGTIALIQNRRVAVKGLGILLLVLLPLQPAVATYAVFIAPERNRAFAYRRPNIRPLMAQIAAQRTPGDRIYVLSMIAPVFAYYADQYPQLKGAEIRTLEADASFPSGRAWFLYENSADLGGLEEAQRKLSSIGRPIRAYSVGSAILLLYEVNDTRTRAERAALVQQRKWMFQLAEVVPAAHRR